MKIYIIKYGYDYESGGETVGVFLSEWGANDFFDKYNKTYGDYYELECWNVDDNELIWSRTLEY